MPDWHQAMFQVLPVASLVVVFFLAMRSRLDKIEVRMDHIEIKAFELARKLDEKQDSRGCTNLHTDLHKRLDQLTEDVRSLLGHVIELSLVVKNGNGASGGK